jgi:hypothetical protein
LLTWRLPLNLLPCCMYSRWYLVHSLIDVWFWYSVGGTDTVSTTLTWYVNIQQLLFSLVTIK